MAIEDCFAGRLGITVTLEEIDGKKSNCRRKRADKTLLQPGVCNRMGSQPGGKGSEADFFRRAMVVPVLPAIVGCQKQTCPIVQPLPKKLGHQDFITLGVGRAMEFIEDLEMGLLDANRALRLRAIFKDEDITKPRALRWLERPFSVRGPKVGCVA